MVATNGCLTQVVHTRERTYYYTKGRQQPGAKTSVTGVDPIILKSVRAILTSSRFAHYDKNGNYQGQLIPFSIAPLGVIGLGEAPGTIKLLTGSECAERIWYVTLSLQGENLTDYNSTYTGIELLHKNSFYSQWCLEPAEGQGDVQSASVRPARNLFKDPVWGSGNYGTTSTADSEYVVAPVDAYHNISWEEFQSPEFHDGHSEALACRGLYGEYAVFFPAEILSIDGSQGLLLNHVDDIWLRFDYVSAAKRWE
jgi:hypothetical protein